MALVDQYAGIIFDYGGVLVRTNLPRMQPAWLRSLDFARTCCTNFTGPTRLAYDKGLVTAEQYWNDMARRAGKTFTSDQIEDLIDADVESWLNSTPRCTNSPEVCRAGQENRYAIEYAPGTG